MWTMVKKSFTIINNAIMKLDKYNWWWFGLFLLAAAFLPIAILEEGSVFEIHDQLDETLLTYVFNAKYFGSGIKVFPEMLGGVNASGMQPSAVLFVFLYKIFPVFTAFVLQYLIVCASGYYGMYFTVRALTDSSILAILIAGIFCMLPIQPIYGLSVLGVPLLVYAFICLYQKKKIVLSFILIAFFGLTTHLVLIGYVVLSFWLLAILIMMIRRNNNKWITIGFAELIGVYCIINRNLFIELIFSNSSYASHREELINYGYPVWENIKSVFLESGQHVPSYHKYLIIPIVILLIIGGINYKKRDKKYKNQYWITVGIFAVLVFIAVFYGISRSETVALWKNGVTGFFRYFQIERYYWLYPSLWYGEIALLLGLFWREKAKWLPPILKLFVIVAILLPTAQQVKKVSNVYMNVNQINNGSGITDYITWENFFAEDLMQKLEERIGREVEDYRIAHLGISPAPALMHGFYTIDGYSNNYPLEYKHEFRKIIQDELEDDLAIKTYFDDWGSRCYLFNGETGVFWFLSKESEFKFHELDINIVQMKKMGCDYLFSGGLIMNAKELGLECMGYYETHTSYWGVWLYRL